MAATYTYAVRYEAEARCSTPLRTGGNDGDTEQILRSWDGTALLQGSSIAGALREHLAALDPDMAEKLFGSQKQSGHLIVSDGVFDADAQCQTRSRLRIDRATGTAAAGGKFDVAHLAADSRFSFTLTWLGLTRDEGELRAVEGLLAALHSGQIRLGGQKSGGFGRVRLTVRRRCFDLTEAQSSLSQLLLLQSWERTKLFFS